MMKVIQADRLSAGPYAPSLRDMQDIFDGKADGLDVVQAFAARAAQARQEVLDRLPDYIDLFRIIRKAGRSDSAKAKAVFAALQTPADALQEQKP